MIPALVKQLGSTFNKSAGTTLALTTTGATSAGNLIVARVLFDNFTTASKPVVSSITTQAGETATWTFLGAARSTSTSAGAFASGELWCIQTTVAWSAAAYTVTLDESVTMKAVMFQEFSGVSATQRSTAGTNYSTTTTAASATTTGTTPVTNDLALGFIFGSNVAAAQAGDNDTTAGSWSTPVGFGSTGGSGATNNYGIGQYKVLTAGTHQTLNNSAAMTAGNGAIVAILQSLPDPSITQAAYRFYADGTESGSTALAAQNTTYTADISAGDVALQIRTLMQSTTAVDIFSTDDWQLQYEINNNGSWINVEDALVEMYTAGGGTISGIRGATTGMAQSFMGMGASINHVSVQAGVVGTPPPYTITVSIYAHSGTFGSGGVPTGTALVTANNTMSSTSMVNGTYYDFYFPEYYLTKGTPYCLVVEGSNSDTSNYVGAVFETVIPRPLGNGATKVSGSWASSTSDMHFYAYCNDQTILYSYRNTSPSGYNMTTTGWGHSQSILGTGTKLATTRAYLNKAGAPSGTVQMHVYAHSGTFGTSSIPTGSPLHSSAPIATSNIVAGGVTWYDFFYDGTYTLENGTNYCIVVVPSSGDASNYISSPYDVSSLAGNRAHGTVSAMTPVSGNSALFEVVGNTAATVVGSTNIDHLDATTSRLTGGSGSFQAGKYTQSGLISNFAWSGNNNTELLFGVKLCKNTLSNGDVVKFRILRNSSTSNLTYTQTPTINITGTYVPRAFAGYRFYADGTETASTALAEQNTAPVVDVSSGDVNLQLRTMLEVAAPDGLATDDYQLQYEKNSNGSWINVTDVFFERYTAGSTVTNFDATGPTAVSQSFMGTNGRLTRAEVSLIKIGAGTPATSTFTAYLYAHSGTFGTSSVPTGTALATSNPIAAVDIPTTTASMMFYFPTPYFIASGTNYCLVVKPDVNGSSTDYYRAWHGGTPPITYGNYAAFSSSTWTPTSSDNLLFVLHTDSQISLYSTRGQNASGYSITTTGHGQSQSITGNSTRLLKTRAYSSKIGSPTGTVGMAVYAHSGTFGTSSIPTGSPLHSSATVDISTYITANRWVDFVYDGTYILAHGTNYCIVIAPSSVDTSNYLLTNYTTGDFAAGNRASGAISGMTADQSTDALIEVFGATAATVGPTANIDQGDTTTNRLTGGSGSFVSGKFTQTGLITDLGVGADNYTELLFGVTIKADDLINGNTLRFRVLRNGTTTGLTYTQTPTINITKTTGATGSVRPYIKVSNPAIARSYTR